MAIGYVTGGGAWETVGAYFLVVSSGLAFYTASAMMLESSYNRTLLPLGALGAHHDARRRPIRYDPPHPGEAVPR